MWYRVNMVSIPLLLLCDGSISHCGMGGIETSDESDFQDFAGGGNPFPGQSEEKTKDFAGAENRWACAS